MAEYRVALEWDGGMGTYPVEARNEHDAARIAVRECSEATALSRKSIQVLFVVAGWERYADTPPASDAAADPEAEIRRLSEELDRLRVENAQLSETLVEIAEVCADELGDWSGIDWSYVPRSLQGYKTIEDAIREVIDAPKSS